MNCVSQITTVMGLEKSANSSVVGVQRDLPFQVIGVFAGAPVVEGLTRPPWDTAHRFWSGSNFSVNIG
ncbi:hypothetical protein RRG08_029742 [Elysia crispata]|uniref:Uncharacterized protein n=1 Tax=Elysia crispata TaxID=231223 RepID=A0AAE1B698_9GAST|nr:hypothetical protein RRG08_029742 [Elysia crispata]